MKTRRKFVDTAKRYLGCKESNGTHKKIIDVYNRQKKLPRGYKVKYTDSWCATYVSAMAIVAGYTSIIPTECSCQYMIEEFKKIGCWRENENYIPKAGDIIFYDWDDNGKGDNKGWSDHVGIVSKVSGDSITVIEGNYKNGVGYRTIKVNGKNIRGYGLPKFEEEKKEVIELPSLKGYKGFSIVDGLKAYGYNSSFSYRKKLWKLVGKTSVYMGTSKQNTQLLNILKGN